MVLGRLPERRYHGDEVAWAFARVVSPLVQRRLNFCGRCFYKVKKLPGLLLGRVAFLCKGARANVRGATLLMQGCLSICRSSFTTCAKVLALLRKLHLQGDIGACTFAGPPTTLCCCFSGLLPPFTTRVSGEGSRLPGAKESTRACVSLRKSSRYLSCLVGTMPVSSARTRRARRRCSPVP